MIKHSKDISQLKMALLRSDVINKELLEQVIKKTEVKLYLCLIYFWSNLATL